MLNYNLGNAKKITVVLLTILLAVMFEPQSTATDKQKLINTPVISTVTTKIKSKGKIADHIAKVGRIIFFVSPSNKFILNRQDVVCITPISHFSLFLRMSVKAGAIFKDFSQSNIGKSMQITYNENILSRTTIQSALPREMQISTINKLAYAEVVNELADKLCCLTQKEK